MEKRGQFYIIVALIVGVLVFFIVSQSNLFIQEKPSTEFSELSENYVVESNKLVNSLLGAPREEVEKVLAERTTEYVYQYAKTKDPSFGLIYVFSDSDKATVESYLDAKVIIDSKGGKEVLTNPDEVYTLGTLDVGGVKIPQGYTYRQVQQDFPQYFKLLNEKFTEEVDVNEGDTIIIDVEGVQYYFNVGDTAELKAVARRTQGDQVQVFQTLQE
ncbi:MAG: hypothetical protein HYS32_00470 [Candidatus Woesearchaeota archaeon]|nr:MAG: hypothetical protein HYS32_00470 [Candidatus Woesearchaeota archaeon]